MKLRHGFKAECERQSAQLRGELDLSPTAPLHAAVLAEHLAIPTWTISGLLEAAPGASVLLGDHSEAVSALTVFDETRRVIVVNDSHSQPRQNSSIAHELSHGLLLHPPQAAMNGHGLRHWRGELEEEANWLAGVLLLPSVAAWQMTRQGVDDGSAMALFGISAQMLRWRYNQTGVTKDRRRRLAASA